MKNVAHKTDPTVITIPNDFSGFAVDELKDQFELLVEQDSNFVVLDFSKTEFIDSSGIGAIVFYIKELKNKVISYLYLMSPGSRLS